MKKYKLRLLHEQIKYLYESLNTMFHHQYTLDNIDHVSYYNIRSFLKRLHDKLFQFNSMNIDVKYLYGVTIDINEAKALKELYALREESISENPYLNILFLEVAAQIEKQEVQLMNRHKYLNPPTILDRHKSKIDNLKKLEP